LRVCDGAFAAGVAVAVLVLGACVLVGVAFDVAEVPGLSGQDRLVASAAVDAAGAD